MDYATSSRSKLRHNGFALSKTFGRSMRPLIWGGEHCVAVAPLSGEPSVGDLLMFRMRQPDGTEKSIVHRLVEIKAVAELGNLRSSSDEERNSETPAANVYITRGDNCIGTETVSRQQIIGRVVEVHRIAGWRPWHIIPRKKFAVSDRSYRLYSRIWAAIWPMRRLYYALRVKLGL